MCVRAVPVASQSIPYHDGVCWLLAREPIAERTERARRRRRRASSHLGHRELIERPRQQSSDGRQWHIAWSVHVGQRIVLWQTTSKDIILLYIYTALTLKKSLTFLHNCSYTTFIL